MLNISKYLLSQPVTLINPELQNNIVVSFFLVSMQEKKAEDINSRKNTKCVAPLLKRTKEYLSSYHNLYNKAI